MVTKMAKKTKMANDGRLKRKAERYRGGDKVLSVRVMMLPGSVKAGMKLMAPPGLVEVLRIREDGWCWCRYIWSYHHPASSALGVGCEGWWKENMLRRKRPTDTPPEYRVLGGVSRIVSGGQRGEYPSTLK